MLTLDSILQFPDCVSFTFAEKDAILLNTRTNKYYALDEIGARLWAFLNEGKNLMEGYQALLKEYEVEPAQLEQDILELVDDLIKHGLLEIFQA